MSFIIIPLVRAADMFSLPKINHDNIRSPCRRFVAGVILRERLPSFERLLWRVCHGNVFLRQCDIDVALEDPTSGDLVSKSVFIIFFQGDQLKAKVLFILFSHQRTNDVSASGDPLSSAS